MRAPTLAILCALALPGVAAAEPASWLSRAQLTGNWGGARDELAERGIDPFARYTGGFWSNVRGGFETGTRYEGFAEWGFDVDLEAALALRGTRLHLGWHSYHGGQPSRDLVGQFFSTAVSGHEAETSVRFFELYVRQELLSGRLAVELGQLAADKNFFVSEYSADLLQANFGSFALERDDQVVPAYPLAAPGAYVSLTLAESWLVRLGVYVADPGDDEPDNVGFDWSFEEGGVLFGEVAASAAPFGRAGRYTLGAVGTNTKLDDQKSNRGPSRKGGYSLYAMIDQALGSEGSALESLGAFARVQIAPQQDRVSIHLYVDGGLHYTAPIPGRGEDVAVLGLAYLELSEDSVRTVRGAGLDVSGSQLSMEFSYRAQLAGWLTLQPDLQLFIDPTFSRRDAVVVGLRAVIEL